MKSLVALLLVAAQPAWSQTFHTQDRLNYVVTLTDGSDWKSCAERICRISSESGSGDCYLLETTGIVGANLSSKGVLEVQALKCVAAVEVEDIMEGQPRVGRGN